MRTLVLLFTIIVLCCPIQSQTILLEEDFEGASSLPPGWSEINSALGNHWSISPVNNSHYLVIPGHTSYVSLNEGDNDKVYSGEYLITPSFDLTNYTSVYISLDIFFKSMTYQNVIEEASIEATLDGGNSWLTIKNLGGFENWHTIYADISQACNNPSVKIAFKYKDNNGWLYGIAIDNVKVFVPCEKDGSIQQIKKYDFVLVNDTIFFKGVVQNFGTELINSLDINWRVNEGNIHSQNFSSISLSPLDTVSFIHSIPWIPSTQEPFDIKIWTSNVNGMPDENPLNDTANIHVINAVTSIPEKNAFLEVFGANWCSICPHGAAKIAEIKDSIDNLIVAVIHVDDSFSSNAGTEIYENYHLFPGWLVSGLIDRNNYSSQVSIDMDRYLWPPHVYKRVENISPVSLSLSNNYNQITKELDIFLSATFECDLNGDYRFNCYLIEDSLIEEQVNCLTIEDREPYCFNENWIYEPLGTIQNYIHMNVVREILGGSWGAEGSLPGNIIAGSPYDFQFGYTLPDNFDENNLRIIGIVQTYNPDSSKCMVLNTKTMYIDISSKINYQSKNDNIFSIYPNPAQNQLFIVAKFLKKNSLLEIKDVTGKLIMREDIDENEFIIDVSSFSVGMYLVTIINSEKTQTQKVLIR